MNARPLLAIALAVAACSPSPRPKPPAAAAPPPPAPSLLSPAPLTTSPTTPEEKQEPPASVAAADPPLAWGTRPPRSSDLYPVIDGMCIHAEVWPVDGATLLTYGNATGAYSRGGERMTLALLTDAGADTGSTITMGLSGQRWQYPSPTHIEGRWPDRVVLLNDRSGRVDDRTDVWVRDASGWRFVLANDETEDAATTYAWPALWGDELALLQRISTRKDDGTHYADHLRGVHLGGGSARSLPALLRPGEVAVALASFRDELVLVGERSGANRSTGFMRFTAQGSVKEEVIDDAGHPYWDFFAAGRHFLVLSSKEFSRHPFLLRFDGSHVSHDAPLEKVARDRHANVVVAAVGREEEGDEVWLGLDDGTVWVERRDGSVVERTPPEPLSNGGGGERKRAHRATEGSVLSGVEQGDPWALTKSGSLYRWTAGAWKKVELPHPPFTTSGAYEVDAIVHTADDVW